MTSISIMSKHVGYLADIVQNPIKIRYESIPNFPTSTVPGHVGQLVFGHLGAISLVCMQGRFHYYEGYPLWKCTIPIRVLSLLGVEYIIFTNAAGGLISKYKVGDIVFVKDRVNLMGFAGNNPLQGMQDDRLGPRFLCMKKAYEKDLRDIALKVAENQGIADTVHEGVITCVGGPNYETIAELRMLQMVGIDVVGMSTVHEVITAKQCSMKPLAFSLITNICSTDYDDHEEANHQEVCDVGQMMANTLKQFVITLVGQFDLHRLNK